MEALTIHLDRYGPLIVFFMVLVEQAGLPIPSTPLLLICGALAARGEISGSFVLLMAVVASLLGDTVWFALGRRHGRRILKMLCRISLNPESCVRRTERAFHHYGLYSIVLGKSIPGLSAVAVPMAGAMGVGAVPFALAASAGALIWIGGTMAIGWFFRGALEQVAGWLGNLGSRGLLLV